MITIFLALATTAAPDTGHFFPKTQAVLTEYGACLARKTADLEPSGAPAQDVISAAITACKTYQETSLIAIIVDADKRYPNRKGQNDLGAEKALDHIEHRMRENLMLQVLERRSERNIHAKN